MATCENPACRKDVAPIDVFALVEEDGVHYFCDEKCRQERDVLKEEVKPTVEGTEPVKRDVAKVTVKVTGRKRQRPRKTGR